MKRATTLGATLVLGFSAISAAQVDPGNGQLDDCAFGSHGDGTECTTTLCDAPCPVGFVTCPRNHVVECEYNDDTQLHECKCVLASDPI